jgi:putative nucleotidyltransferase with HDIG domain
MKMALEVGEAALRSILRSAESGPARSQDMAEASQSIMGSLDTYGLGVWINMVKSHHSATYQHCLTVSGLAASLGRRLGLNTADRELLTIASLFHDIGKSLVPIEILEKPTSLTPDENVKFREHPTLGRKIIERSESFDPKILNVVSNHHEYLDGSGYPNKLSGAEIPDLTRLITICDVFSYLIERRPNKLELPYAHAFGYLSAMTRQLDMPLVKAFKSVVDDL